MGFSILISAQWLGLNLGLVWLRLSWRGVGWLHFLSKWAWGFGLGRLLSWVRNYGIRNRVGSCTKWSGSTQTNYPYFLQHVVWKTPDLGYVGSSWVSMWHNLGPPCGNLCSINNVPNWLKISALCYNEHDSTKSGYAFLSKGTTKWSSKRWDF